MAIRPPRFPRPLMNRLPLFASSPFSFRPRSVRSKRPKRRRSRRRASFMRRMWSSGKGGDTTLHLDIARPEKSDKRLPCIVVIHGGGWRGGNFKVHVPQILEFAKHGYVSATVQYRLVPAGRLPAQIEDVKCAVRYLRANADKYGINKERFGAVGFSGGHIFRCCWARWIRKTAWKATAATRTNRARCRRSFRFLGRPTWRKRIFWRRQWHDL